MGAAAGRGSREGLGALRCPLRMQRMRSTHYRLQEHAEYAFSGGVEQSAPPWRWKLNQPRVFYKALPLEAETASLRAHPSTSGGPLAPSTLGPPLSTLPSQSSLPPGSISDILSLSPPSSLSDIC